MTTTDTEPTRWRKKPVEIEAMQLAGTTSELHAVYLWVEDHVGGYDFTAKDKPDAGVSIDPADGRLVIRTLEGEMHADFDDWIIRGVQGEFYPCKPDIFEQTYEPAEPHPVARVELFTDTTGDHHWRAIARNGEIVATSGEGYRNAAHARAMAERILPGVGVRDEEADRG